MKTVIEISGQIGGNFTLLNRLSNGNFQKTNFNGFLIEFSTKKDAINQIREAYNCLCREEPEQKNRLSGIRTNKSRTVLLYDASKAIIIEFNQKKRHLVTGV